MARRAARPPTAVVVLAIAIAIGVAWWQSRSRTSAPAGSPTVGTAAPAPVGPAPAPAPVGPAPTPAPPASVERAAPPPTLGSSLDLAWLADRDERATVVEVAAAIDRGGPFRYRKDGAVFENREGRLPRQARGYWREYTVPTPGEADRGARRLVGGARHELYYSRDHYRTFRLIRPPTP